MYALIAFACLTGPAEFQFEIKAVNAGKTIRLEGRVTEGFVIGRLIADGKRTEVFGIYYHNRSINVEDDHGCRVRGGICLAAEYAFGKGQCEP